LDNSALSIRVLGPVEVLAGTSWRQITAPRQRAALAVLAMNRRALVRADSLAEDLWPREPPRNPANQLHVLVHRLRQRLGDHDASILQSRSAGYVLMVEDEQTDVGQFESLVLHAGAALRGVGNGGQPDEAERLCTEAMTLWRGELCADTELPASLGGAAMRLAEERLDLQETLIDIRLLLGRHKELIPRLTEATAAHPLREHLWAQLMRAYYRSGRQADALEVYRRVYALLGTELGTEPGQELQDLHKRMLAGDESLRTPPSAGSPPANPPGDPRTRPRQLPAACRNFTGRTDELRRISAIADSTTGETTSATTGDTSDDRRGSAAAGSGTSGDTSDGTASSDYSAGEDESPLIVLTGPGGVGKTSLAVHWGHKHADRFPDGQLYVDLRGLGPGRAPARASQTVSYLLTALGAGINQQPPTLDDKTALYRTLMAGRQMLLILDNARDAAQVRPLLPGAGRCVVIVTSRSPLASLAAVEGADILHVDVLTAGQADELLRRYIGAERVAAESGAAADVARQCAYLPLALTVAAARAAVLPGFTLSALSGELADSAMLPHTLNAGERDADVWAVLSWSYRAASPAAKRMFRLLSLHPGPDLTAEAAAHLTGTSMAATRDLLRELTMTSLISEKTPGRYSFHDLLRAYSRDLSTAVDAAAHRDRALGGLLGYYAYLAHRAAVTIEPDRDHEVDPPTVPAAQALALTDPRAARAWFTREHRSLIGLVDAASAADRHAQACHLAWAMTDHCRRSGVWEDWLHVVHVAIDASSSLGDVRVIANARRSLGHAYCWHGRLDEGQRNLEEALSMFEAAGDRAGQGHAHRNLADLYERRWDDAKALRHAELAVRCYQSAGHAAGIARSLNTLGWYLAKNGQCDQAVSRGEEAQRLLQELGHQPGEAATWVTLGFAHHQLGQLPRAAECFENGLLILRDIGDRETEAGALIHLADTQEAAGRHAEARLAWQDAREILTVLNHPDPNAILRGLRNGPPGDISPA
jgi:DNA-binding SARP family transcriptional activator/Tfp pilus assembly protein PilF